MCLHESDVIIKYLDFRVIIEDHLKKPVVNASRIVANLINRKLDYLNRRSIVYSLFYRKKRQRTVEEVKYQLPRRTDCSDLIKEFESA